MQDQFTVTSQDGSATGTVTVTITGTNDAATVSSDSKSVTEGDTAAALNTSGALTITDPDTGEAHVVAQTSAHGTYGDFSIDADGSWTYTGNGAHNELVADQQVQDQFTVTSQDGTATGTVTVTITGTNDAAVLDLDANNSTATGSNYVATFTDTGSAVAIADSDVSIIDPDNANMASATVTLTNAKAGDVLGINGSLPAGIGYTINTATPGVITVTLSGSASKAAYDAALNQIVFSTSVNPDTTDRNITVVVNDGLANGNTATSTIHVVDATSPTVSSIAIVDAGADGTVHTGETGTVTITFSEKVTGFTASDVTVTNGSIGAVSSSDGGKTWTATFTPAATTEATAHISVANTYTDLAGNAGTASAADGTILVDTKSPTVSSIAIVDAGADGTVHTGETGTVTITFSEKVTGFTASDVTVTNGSIGAVSSSDGGKTWTATFTPAATTEATAHISVANTYTDLAGNAGTASAADGTILVDTKSPTVVITTSHHGSSSDVTFTFSEAVSGFSSSDVTIVGGNAGTITHVGVNGSGQDIYTETVTQANGSGSHTIQVTGSYTDLAGNAGSASNLATLPAGVAGQPINLGLVDPSVDHVVGTTITVAGVPSGWTLSEGTDNGDGTWTVVTNDVASLSITSPEQLHRRAGAQCRGNLDQCRRQHRTRNRHRQRRSLCTRLPNLRAVGRRQPDRLQWPRPVRVLAADRA